MPRIKTKSKVVCKCGGTQFEASIAEESRNTQPALRCTRCGATVTVDKTTFALHQYIKSSNASADFLRLFDLN